VRIRSCDRLRNATEGVPLQDILCAAASVIETSKPVADFTKIGNASGQKLSMKILCVFVVTLPLSIVTLIGALASLRMIESRLADRL